MQETIQNLISQLENNSLLVTLFSGGLVVTIFMYAKSILGWLWGNLISLISFKITNRFDVKYDQPQLLKKLLFLLNNKSTIIWMNQVEIMEVADRDTTTNQPLATAPHGISLRFMYGKFIRVDKYFEAEGNNLATTVTIQVFFCFKKNFLKKFLEDLKNTVIKESTNNIMIDILGAPGIEKAKRDISTIYSSNNAPQTLLSDIRKFISNSKCYDDSQIPYKRNYLLYGKPGTGKTSSILAVASMIDWNIVIIDITKNRLDDVVRCMSNRNRTIFLFEDIDSSSKNIDSRKKSVGKKEIIYEDTNDISLGQLLNLTDGLMTPHGCICIFTTNHIDMLDDAFLRDGRMDVKLEYDYFDSDTVKKVVNDTTGISLVNPKTNVCPATLQESILKWKLGTITTKDIIHEWENF